MITFTIGKDGYFIDDDFNVITGKNKKEIQKDIDLFFMDFGPSDGDEVLVYKERLEKEFGAEIKDFYSVKYPEGTVDCADYEEYEPQMAKDSNYFNKIIGFFKRGKQAIPLKEKDTDEIISKRKLYASSFGFDEKTSEQIAKKGILDNTGMPQIFYRGHNESEDVGGDWLLGRVYCLSNKYEIAKNHGIVKKYFVVPNKPHVLESIKKSKELFDSGKSDCCVVKNPNTVEIEVVVKDKACLFEIK